VLSSKYKMKLRLKDRTLKAVMPELSARKIERWLSTSNARGDDVRGALAVGQPAPAISPSVPSAGT
jgi:hypothetical protein